MSNGPAGFNDYRVSEPKIGIEQRQLGILGRGEMNENVRPAFTTRGGMIRSPPAPEFGSPWKPHKELARHHLENSLQYPDLD